MFSWNLAITALYFALGGISWILLTWMSKPQPEVYNPSLYSLKIVLDADEKARVEAKQALKASVIAIMEYIVFYFFISGFFQLYYTSDGFGTGYYTKMLQNKNNWVRWIEYAATSRVMIMALSFLSGVKEIAFSILTLFAIPVMMVQGNIVEEAVNGNTSKTTAIASFWLLYISIFWLVLQSFIARCKSMKEAGFKTPMWIYFVVYGSVAWFASYGIIQILYVIYNKKWSYNFFDKLYTGVDLAAKFYMGALVIYGYSQYNNAKY